MKNIPLLSRAPRFSHMLLAVLASVVFGGCSPYQKAAPQPEPTVPLTGMVTYRARMALPPDAELTVTLHRKTSDGRMLVAEERASTEGRNVPLPFSIACPAADSSSMSYELEAAISSGGTTLFATTRPLMVHPGDADIMVLTHRVMDAVPVTDGLAGTRWKLVELNGKPAEVYDNQPEPHLLFNPEGAQGRISGSDGCNSLIGSYTLQGDRIGFSQLGSTMMLCPKGDAQGPLPFRIPGTHSICGAAKRGWRASKPRRSSEIFGKGNKSETRLTHKGNFRPSDCSDRKAARLMVPRKKLLSVAKT